jgi:glycosyltransferase involved in cell wall biosynthesis
MIRRPIIAHCWYRVANPSGENLVVEREHELLRAGGGEPVTWFRRSDDLLARSPWAKLTAGWMLHAPPQRIAALRSELAALDGEVLHLHNPWPLLTYGAFEAARQLGLPAVQTLHNFRLIASNDRFHGAAGPMLPESHEDRIHLRRLAASHGGRTINAFYNRALARYWSRRVPQVCVDAYICLTEFHRRIFALAGLPDEKLVVKPNFLAHRGPVGDGDGDYVLFVGRLSPEKGADLLVRSWAHTRLPLKVVGAGPLASLVGSIGGAEYLGPRPPSEVLELMARARFLVVSSTGYEGFPLVLVEALASGTPALVPDLGGMPDIIEAGRLGAVFTPGIAADFVHKARELWEVAPHLRSSCRAEYEARYTPERNLAMLRRIYDNAVAGRRADDGVSRYFDPPRRNSSRRVFEHADTIPLVLPVASSSNPQGPGGAGVHGAAASAPLGAQPTRPTP